MRDLRFISRAKITPMNVPVHQVMFTFDHDVPIPPKVQEIRSIVGGNLYRLWSLDDTRTLIGDAYKADVLRTFDMLALSLIQSRSSPLLHHQPLWWRLPRSVGQRFPWV